MINNDLLKQILNKNAKQALRHRKWTSKKTGLTTSKTYVYNKFDLLFRKTKYGYKVIDSAWKKFEQTIKDTIKDPGEATKIINEARTIRQNILHGADLGKFGTSSKHYQSAGQKGWNRIDVKSMISRIASQRVEKYLYNMGLTIEGIANYFNQETGETLNTAEFLNEGCWENDTAQVHSVEGNFYEIRIAFSYQGYSAVNIKRI